MYIQRVHPSYDDTYGQSTLILQLKLHIKWPSTEAFGTVLMFNIRKSLSSLTTGLGFGVYTLPGFTPLEALCPGEGRTSGLDSTTGLIGSITDGVGM